MTWKLYWQPQNNYSVNIKSGTGQPVQVKH